MHGSEGRTSELRESNVVESGDRDIARNAQSASACFAKYADRHYVVHADDGGGIEARIEEFACRRASAFQAVLIGNRAKFHAFSKTLHGLEQGSFALTGGTERGVVADEREPPVTERV